MLLKDFLINNQNLLDDECKKIGISSEKVMHSPICCNDKVMFVQYHDQDKGKNGLMDDGTPAKVLLTIEKDEDGSLIFTPADDIKEYLA